MSAASADLFICPAERETLNGEEVLPLLRLDGVNA
jgi:hypothetical protein